MRSPMPFGSAHNSSGQRLTFLFGKNAQVTHDVVGQLAEVDDIDGKPEASSRSRRERQQPVDESGQPIRLFQHAADDRLGMRFRPGVRAGPLLQRCGLPSTACAARGETSAVNRRIWLERGFETPERLV